MQGSAAAIVQKVIGIDGASSVFSQLPNHCLGKARLTCPGVTEHTHNQFFVIHAAWAGLPLLASIIGETE